MADVFDDVFEGIGEDFAAFMPGTKPVTVRSIDPVTGATLAAAENVTALKRSRRRRPFGVQGGIVGSDQCRFVLRASEVAWLPKAQDEIDDADGVKWQIDSVEAIAFNQLYACDATKRRS